MSSGTTRRSKLLRTIGMRLTIWGTGVTLAVCAILCVLLYAGLFYALRGEIDTFLEGEVHEFMVIVNSHPNDDAGLEHAIRYELGSRARHDLAFRLLDQEGQVIVTSEPDDPTGNAWIPPRGWRDSEPHLYHQTVSPAGQTFPFRICSLRVTTADGRACTAQAVYLLDRMTASLTSFRRVCAVALVLATFFAVAAGWIVSRRSLRPVRILTETAKQVGADTLGRRVPLAGTDDELDRLAETINGMLDRIERHVRQMRQFTADASHELRSPLAALRGNAEVALNRDRTVEELRRVLEDSIDHYDRLSRIAEDLLLLAKADAGRPIIRQEKVQLDRAVRGVIELYEPLACDLGIRLQLEDCRQILLEGDGARLRQLVGNLLDNAIKHTDAGGRIRISLASMDGSARLEITDTGSGIPAEHLSRVFDRFYRVDRARSARHGGAGLGLAISRTIVEAHGGSIRITSEPGEGTTVYVELPAISRLPGSSPMGCNQAKP
jgi:heavy metal sensor kinase